MADKRSGRKSAGRRSGKGGSTSRAGKPASGVASRETATTGMRTMLDRYLRRGRTEIPAPAEITPVVSDPVESLYQAREYDYLLAIVEETLEHGGTPLPRHAWRYARFCVETGQPERLIETAKAFSAAAWQHRGFRSQYFQALIALDRIAEAHAHIRESLLFGVFDSDFLMRVVSEYRHLQDDDLIGAVIDLAIRQKPGAISPAERIVLQNVLLNIDRPLDALRASATRKTQEHDVDRHLLLANAAILSKAPVDAVAHFNQALALQKLAPIALRDPDRPFSAANLTAGGETLAQRNGPLVTVAMATYNARDTIVPALMSLSAQTYRDLEILVVDDCSKDDTIDVVARYAGEVDDRVRVIRMAENGGSYRARNRALAEARGVYFTCNDADDWSHPEKIALLVDGLEKRKVAAISSRLVRLNPEIGIKPRRMGYIHADMSSTLFRRESVIERIGYYDPARFGADSEYAARLALAFGEEAIATLGRMLLVADWSEATLTSSKGTGISDGGVFYPRRGRYRHAFRIRHARGEGIRLDRDGKSLPLEEPESGTAAGPLGPIYQRSRTRAGWHLDQSTLVYRDPAIELFWKMPEGFAMPSNALLSLAEALLFRPHGRTIEVEAGDRSAALAGGRVGLAYSGGIDSSAALQLLPDPIAIHTQVANPTGLHRIENALMAVEEVGGISIVSNHDELPALFGARRGYYGFGGFTVTAILLADHLNLATVADGNVVDSVYLLSKAGHGTRYIPQDFSEGLAMFARAGLQYCAPCAGISEVSTDRLARSVVHAMGCMRGTGGKACGACIKCYRKSALRGAPIPTGPDIERALAREPIRMLGALLWARDNRGLSHPRLDGLVKDISWVDKWYPRSIEMVPEDLRPYLLDRLAHYGIAPLEDVTSVETWDARREPPSRPAGAG